MGGKQPAPRVTWLGRFMQGRRPDRNPLRRASDRVETVVLAALAIAFLAAAPFTGQASGAWARDLAHRTQLEQEASWRQVPAVMLKAVPKSQGDSGYATFQTDTQARWTAPDGTVVTGEIPVPPGTAAGATVRVWTTRDGQLTNPPLEDSQVAGQAILAEVLSVIALGILLIVIGAVAHRALDKRRMAAWDADWRATGPRWTTRA
jgi:hypothetical protein